MQRVKNRSIALFVILWFLTLGIYPLVAFCIMSNEINDICEGDGKHTMFYLWAGLLGLVTIGIYPIVWCYQAMERLADNGYRYGVNVKHSGKDFLLWCLLGLFLGGIGPIVANCYFVSDVNQFSDYVGFIPAKRYTPNPIERMQISQEPFFEFDPYGNVIDPQTGAIVQNAGAYGDANVGYIDQGGYQDPNYYDAPNGGYIEQGGFYDNQNGFYDTATDVAPVTNKAGGTIIGISGDYSGYPFPINPGEEIIIGRDPSVANIIIDGKYTTVSKKQCSISFDPINGLYTVTDFSSNNSTTVGEGNKLQPNMPIQLTGDTIITIGAGENSFRLD